MAQQKTTVTTSHDGCDTCRNIANMIQAEMPYRGSFGPRTSTFIGDGKECRVTVTREKVTD